MATKVLIVIQNGVASIVQKPKGINVEIRDYDIEGDGCPEERNDCFMDADGDWYQKLTFNNEDVEID